MRFSERYNFLLPRYWFGQVDSRPLSVFRIVFALLLLKVALYQLPNAYWFYSDRGITPRSTMFEGLLRENRFSLMDAIAAPFMAQGFFMVWVVVLVGLLIGYRTRMMSILNFIFLLSIHERNLYVVDGSDNVMRVTAFWCMFIPLAQYYSVDAVRTRWKRYCRSQNPADLRVPEQPQRVFAFPVRMLQLQIGLIYLFTFILKLPGEAWKEGEALFYTLQLQSLTLPTGDWVLANFPFELLRLMSYGALGIEGVFFVFVFIHIFQPYLRILGLTLGFLLHFGIGVLMSVPNFSMLMPATYLVFFMPEWIEKIDQQLRLPRQQLLMPLPKNDSPLWLLLAVTKPGEIEFVTEVKTEKWWFADAQKRTYQGENAWREMAAHLPLSRLWGGVLKFKWVQTRLWNIFVHFAPSAPMPVKFHQEVGEIPPAYRLRWEIVSKTLLVLLLGGLMLLVIRWNLTSVHKNNQPLMAELQGVPQAIVQYTGLWQSWNMFSPYPSTVDGWVQIPGVFEDGTRYDLLTEAPLNNKMKRWYFGPGMRWKKYEENLNSSALVALLKAWGGYYCRIYNTDQALPEGERLATLEIHFVWRSSHAPNQPKNDWQTRILWKHWCYGQYAY